MWNEMKYLDHLNFKKLTILITVFVCLDITGVAFACFRKEKNPQQPPITASPYRAKGLSTKQPILIDSTNTCNRNNEPDKKLLICYNKGVCESIDSPLNDTHTEKKVYCLCVSVSIYFKLILTESYYYFFLF